MIFTQLILHRKNEERGSVRLNGYLKGKGENGEDRKGNDKQDMEGTYTTFSEVFKKFKNNQFLNIFLQLNVK